MAITVELTRFRIAAGSEDALLAARPAMRADFRADRQGFLDAELVRPEDNQWLDIVRWASPADLADSHAQKADLPGIEAFFSAIQEVLTSEQGVASNAE